MFMDIPFIAWHPNYKLPLPDNHRFPMLKYELLHDRLLYEGIIDETDLYRPSPLEPELLEGVHDRNYWQRAIALELTDKEIRRSGFPLTEQLLARELHIAQGTLTGAKRALEIGVGFNIAGGTHHAGSNWAEGFCLFNDQAIASHYLLNNCDDINQVLIIDLDVHQGNGTAEIFENDDRVFTFSVHGERNFPFKKETSDLDIGLPDGTEGADYLSILQEQIEALLPAVKPDFVFFQAGADVLATDKLGRLELNRMDCRDRDRLVFETCKKWDLPVQVSMGGGYSEDIKKIVAVHSQTFAEGISTMLFGR